ncbi:MAG TPA: paraquat-inducible protein A, partial [Saprospiraceae bacterium]|nr:paraquat-inducible protein A [Saprospiraceae bacterium]
AFTFELFGQPLSFDQQTLFYQSKSILDVTQNLLEGKTIDLKIVGMMVLCFSVVFPVIKLSLSGLYLAIPHFQKNKLIRAMIFHLGKWSMADVFVVALFMAYVGFYGLITSQLDNIENNKNGFAIETLNFTHLEFGAYFFTLYCMLSIVIGVILARKTNN